MKFPLHQPTLKLLTGLSGIELGAASHNPFGVNAINVAPKFDEDMFQDNQVNMGEQPTKIDMYGEADNIPKTKAKILFCPVMYLNTFPIPYLLY
jgi:hypothetical protein